jgi:malonate transporter
MAAIFGALFPIFALIAVGFACGRVQCFGKDADHVLNAYAANLALPVLMFHIVATMDTRDLMEPVMFTVVVGASALIFALHYFVEWRRGQQASEAVAAAFAASYSNHAFIGLPVCLAVLGAASLAPAAVAMALNSIIIFGIGTLLSVLTGKALAQQGEGAEQSRGRAIRTALWLVARNPLVIGSVGGAAVAFVNISLPQPVDKFLEMVGATTAPAALIAVGLFMARPVPKAAGSGATMRSVAGKLLLMPLVTLGLLWALPPLPLVWQQTALIMAALPSGAGCIALARYGGDDALRMSARIIAISTLFAAVTLPLLLLVMGLGG